jgi:hypothetical protein
MPGATRATPPTPQAASGRFFVDQAFRQALGRHAGRGLDPGNLQVMHLKHQEIHS